MSTEKNVESGAFRDWTIDTRTGRTNSSEEFRLLVEKVASIIQNSGFDLLRGDATKVAGVIMAQLAHKYGLRPVREERGQFDQ